MKPAPLHPSETVRSILGGLVFIGLLCWRPSSPFDVGWARQLLLFSPLVLVPLVVRLAHRTDDTDATGRLLGLAAWLQLPAALLLVLAVEVAPQGSATAGLCALPWLAVTGLLGLAALSRAWRRGLTPWPELAVDLGLIYLPIGGAWALLHALGQRPLDFEPVIVLLTAIHFHYAGLVLPVLAGLAGRRLPGFTSRLVAVGVAIGVPLVAAGITTTQLGGGSLVETLAAWITAAAGLGTALLLVRLARSRDVPPTARALWCVSGLCLAASMVLAALYGTRAWVPESWSSLPPLGEQHIGWMRAWHGTANAIGFALCGCVGWRIAEPDPAPRQVRARLPRA